MNIRGPDPYADSIIAGRWELAMELTALRLTTLFASGWSYLAQRRGPGAGQGHN